MSATEPKPVRLQRSRRKGDRLVSPNGLPVVCVTRPSRWGNPFYVESSERRRAYDEFAMDCKGNAIEMFERYLFEGKLDVRVEDVRRELRGKNLACFCKLGDSCHADVLLRVASSNPPVPWR